MTLHEAIEKLLKQNGRSMTTKEIADELNINKWYKKKDCSSLKAFQIHGRVRNYHSIFHLEGSIVSLIEKSLSKVKSLLNEKSTTNQITKVKSTNIKASFDPIYDSEITILILGTMPGDKSLELGEYYAHSRNKFWKIIATITNNDLPTSYLAKIDLLLNSKIGIWDVVHQANRSGSLDIAIENEQPNDLESFISKNTNLKVIAFNGSKSEAIFDKYFDRKSNLKYISLPSSSPANTRINFESICKL